MTSVAVTSNVWYEWSCRKTFVVKLPWGVVIAVCLTVGLAPYTPPHFYEKLLRRFRGHIVWPIEWLALVLPWRTMDVACAEGGILFSRLTAVRCS